MTIAKRIDPSGHVVLTSVCVGRLPTCRPPAAAPCGSAWPNVAHPGVSVTDATGDCARAGAAKDNSATIAASVAYKRKRPAAIGPGAHRVRSPHLTDMID
ncbi:MAG: hypothetical protein DMF93_18355 [Acidobacteria bacterium]|nr:MAG: hypothetical protein DMF93_18355 [Acidobacteriota bacterium]